MIWRLILVGLMSWSTAVRAETASAQYVVSITAAGSPTSVAALEQRTRALLQSYAVTVNFAIAPQFRARDVFGPREHVALARIWLDARAESRAVLYLVDDAHDRFLVRVVPLDAGYDEVAYESIGTIVQSSVEALLSGASVGVERAEAEAQVTALEPETTVPPSPTPPAPKTAPIESPRSPATPIERRARLGHRLGFDAAYRGQLLHSAPALLHGPELGLNLTHPTQGVSATGQLQLGYRLPTHWSEADVGVKLTGGGARLAGGLRAGMTPWLSVSLLGTIGADWIYVTPEVNGEGKTSRPAFGVLQPMLGAAVEAELRLMSHLAAWMTWGVESDLGGNHFDVLRAGEPEPVLVPWPIQAVVRIGARLRP